jgi:hypothetical protein
MERGPWSLREQWHIIQVNESWVWIAGEQGSLTTKLVHLFDSKPSIVNNGQLITSPGTTWRKWNIMPASGQPSLTVMKLVVWKLYSLNSYMLPFSFVLLFQQVTCIVSVLSKYCSRDATCSLRTIWTSNEILSLWVIHQYFWGNPIWYSTPSQSQLLYAFHFAWRACMYFKPGHASMSC